VARATRCLVVLSVVVVATASFTLRTQQQGTRPVSNTLPSVSPDGSRIVFLSDRQGANGVFLISAEGGDEREVTDGPVQRARWAADGREIILAGDGADSGRVFAVTTDSGNRRIVATVTGAQSGAFPRRQAGRLPRGPLDVDGDSGREGGWLGPKDRGRGTGHGVEPRVVSR